MTKKTSAGLLTMVVLATLAGAFFVYPDNPVLPQLARLQPWRLGLDLVGGAHLIYRVDLSQIQAGDRADVVAGLRDVIERRIDLYGVKEPRVATSQAGGEYYLIVELAGTTNVSDAIREIGETPFLEFKETAQQDGQTVYVSTELNGRFVKGAQLDFNQTTLQPQVAIQFNDEGAKIFEDLTARNVGKVIGVFLDGAPITEPVVNERIAGGNAVITGSFSQEEAKQLVRRFNAGALPAPIELVNQQTVGATLGKDSLYASIRAGAVGTALVVVFMVLYYGFFGFLASLALIVYVVLSLSIFKLFITMSLAGVAGFLLTIGMAVDANVLIFERTKEELKKGMLRTSAVAEGFRRAWPSIRDSNISTIITSFILFMLTTSFVKGLALTLLLGVVVSMFTAITVTRGLMILTVRDKEPNRSKQP
jgi:protein-export membrane protein SecD